MSKGHHFFHPSNRDFHPEMTRAVMHHTATLCESRGLSYQDIISDDSHIAEICKFLVEWSLPHRSIPEVHKEILRFQSQWNRVVELKIIEAGLHGDLIRTDSSKICSPKEYALHVKVMLHLMHNL
jgi:hypothetical protein